MVLIWEFNWHIYHFVRLLKMGALETSKVTNDHEGWRLITCIWLHAGVVHILANMLSLLLIGIRLEKEFGFSKYWNNLTLNFLWFFTNITCFTSAVCIISSTATWHITKTIDFNYCLLQWGLARYMSSLGLVVACCLLCLWCQISLLVPQVHCLDCWGPCCQSW